MILEYLFEKIRQNKKRRIKQNRGFTLAEMITVSAIFGVLTSIIIFRYGDFNASILITNMAYEVAVTTRQAQVFGLGARGFTESDDKLFNSPYGVFFQLNDGTAKENESKRFALFVDKSGDGICGTPSETCQCNGSETDECVEQLTMQRNIVISSLRTSVLSGSGCEAETHIPKLAITFKRPNPEALIERQVSGANGYQFAQIEVSTTGTNENPSYILIRQTGQISVSKTDICTTF